MMVRVALVVPLAVLIVACNRNSVASVDMPLIPVAPSAAIAAPGSVSTAGTRATEGREDVIVNMNMQDACDPDTFNEALQNPEACVRAGGVKFDHRP